MFCWGKRFRHLQMIIATFWTPSERICWQGYSTLKNVFILLTTMAFLPTWKVFHVSKVILFSWQAMHTPTFIWLMSWSHQPTVTHSPRQFSPGEFAGSAGNWQGRTTTSRECLLCAWALITCWHGAGSWEVLQTTMPCYYRSYSTVKEIKIWSLWLNQCHTFAQQHWGLQP